MKQSKRIEYIDAAKGIAILLMIVGHCYWTKAIPGLAGSIYSFHMPLFFIISGMFWKSLSIKAAFGKYAKSYLWPYLIICIAILFIDLANAGLYGGSMPEIVQNGFLKIVWASNCLKPILFGDMPCIGAAWFLFALFWANGLLNLFTRFVGGVEN